MSDDAPQPWSPEGFVEVQRTDRWPSIVVFAGCASVLGLARWLEPSVQGHGTHTQLGLPPCTFWSLTGVPCPLCGGTTTFSLMAHGHVLEAFVTQPFAALLFVLTLGLLGVAGAEAIVPTGRWRRLSARVAPYEAWLAGGFLLAMMAGWTYKIAVMG